MTDDNELELVGYTPYGSGSTRCPASSDGAHTLDVAGYDGCDACRMSGTAIAVAEGATE